MKKKLIYALVAVLLLVGGGFLGYGAYKSARQSSLIQTAKKYLAKHDEKAALLCLRRAIRYNPKDAEASRLMAQLAERERSPAALYWRNQVVQINPKSTDDRLALAQTAMIFGDHAAATNALEGIDPASKKTANYQTIAGSVAASAGLAVQAEAYFLEANRLEPQNAVFQMNLAVVRLHSTNEPSLAVARSTLTQLSVNTTNVSLSCQALRELTMDSLRFNNAVAALALCNRLVQDTNSSFSDRLLQLDVLSMANTNEVKSALAACQKDAGTNAGRIFELAKWQMSRTGPAPTLTWLNTLPSQLRTNMPAELFVVECLAATQNWRALQAAIDGQNWGEMGYTRRAFKTLALRGQDLSGAAKAEWDVAFKIANDLAVTRRPQNPQPLFAMLQFAVRWKWQSEAEDLLWSIVNNFPNEKKSTQALTEVLYAGGRTRPLMLLFSQLNKKFPSDLGIKNNLAVIALLLDAKELRPHELALEVYQKAPTNSAFASSYAFSLYLQQKNAEALKIMQSLPAKDLENPSIAGYYGLILKASGKGPLAKPYLEWAFKSQLLPEEKQLFEKAVAGV